MDILIIRPINTSNGTKYGKENNFRYRRVGESLALGYLASNLEVHGHNVTVRDGVLENLSNKEMVNFIEKNIERFEVIAFSSNVYSEVINNLSITRELGFLLKKKFVVFGGHVATFIFSDILHSEKEIDCIILNEGEETFQNLLKAIEKDVEWRNTKGISYLLEDEVFVNKPNARVNNDLDKLEFPRRDYIEDIVKKQSLVNISTSRGCYGKCSFCSVNAFYANKKQAWVGRTPENVVEEIRSLINLYGADKFLFVDDNYVGPGINGVNRIKRIAELLIEQRINIRYTTNFRANDIIRCKEIIPLLKESGLSYVFIGTESGSNSQLKFFNKGIDVNQNIEAVKLLEKNGIGVLQGLILFDFRISIEEVEENIQYIKSIEGINAGKLYSNLLLYHGTELHKKYCTDNVDCFKPVELPFRDEKVKKVFSIIESTLVWGAELYNKIEDLIWDCYFQYDIEVPDEIRTINNSINDYIINYIEQVIEFVKTDKSTKTIDDEVIKFLLMKFNSLPSHSSTKHGDCLGGIRDGK